jgi:hypothetical protein
MGYLGRVPTSVPLTNSDLDSNIALGGNVDTIGDTYKNYKNITSDTTITISATKNHFLAGELEVSNNAVLTISGGTLTII